MRLEGGSRMFFPMSNRQNRPTRPSNNSSKNSEEDDDEGSEVSDEFEEAEDDDSEVNEIERGDANSEISKDSSGLSDSDSSVLGEIPSSVPEYRKPDGKDHVLKNRFSPALHEFMPRVAKCKKCSEWAFEFKCPNNAAHPVGCVKCLSANVINGLKDNFECSVCNTKLCKKMEPIFDNFYDKLDMKSDVSGAEPVGDKIIEMDNAKARFANVNSYRTHPEIQFAKCATCKDGKNKPVIACPHSKSFHNLGCLEHATNWLTRERYTYMSGYQNNTCPGCRGNVFSIAETIRELKNK